MRSRGINRVDDIITMTKLGLLQVRCHLPQQESWTDCSTVRLTSGWGCSTVRLTPGWGCSTVRLSTSGAGFHRLTIQAAWTASDTFPALGSHQKTWQSKCWLPMSMMKANVWTSRPTPMNDKKRTRHSTSTSASSWSTIRNQTLSVRCQSILFLLYE